MSPVSRKRKKPGRGGAPLRSMPAAGPPGTLLDEHGACECPACVGGEIPDPRQIVVDILAEVEDLVAVADPLEAQIFAALFVGIGASAPTEFEQAVVAGFVPAFEAAGTANALAFLLALASVAPPRAARAARAAADRLATPDVLHPDGLPAPAWAADLRAPLTASHAYRLCDPDGSIAIVTAMFDREGRTHGIAVMIDEEDCGAAAEILVLEGKDWAPALAEIRASAEADGVEFQREDLAPAQFRWLVQQALEARAIHDEDDEPDPGDEDPDQIPYGAAAALLRSHLSALPKAKAPPGAARTRHDHASDTTLQMLAQLIAANRPLGGGIAPRTEALPKLPPRRRKSAGPAPIYRLRVDLRGAKPPIWRRLEVPADIGLDALHEVLQIAFGWYDCHLHEFETRYGRFGSSDPDRALGEGALPEGSATLEQVASGEGGKLRYTYDFGDDWEHDIAVEKVLEHTPGVTYPRCTAGRGAAPPEDCGGIWGYQDLLEVLADPEHDEHADRLEWLGLTDPAQFDPARFSAADVTAALAIP